MRIKINLDRAKIDGVLRALDAGFRDFKPLLKDIADIQLKSADETFKTRGVNLGKPWANLKTATVKQKMRIGKNIDILQRTGKMRRSFRMSKLTNNEVNVENSVEYFKYHQIGTKNMPRRQMLGHSPAMIKRHKIAFVDYTLKLIQA